MAPKMSFRWYYDPLFRFHRWQANLRILDVEEIKSVPYTPQSHPYIERLIGTVRREFLDHLLFWNAQDLQNKLDQFKGYYNDHRAHNSLNNVAPSNKSCTTENNVILMNKYRWKSHAYDLFQLPAAA